MEHFIPVIKTKILEKLLLLHYSPLHQPSPPVFDLKLDVTNLVINNEYYNVVDGVLGSGKFDGLSVVQRIVRDVKAHRFSAAVAALFGVSKLVKFTMYIATIRQTLNKLTPGGTKSGYIYTVVLWLFVYPFASFAFYPDLVYNYYLVTDYGLVLKQFYSRVLETNI